MDENQVSESQLRTMLEMLESQKQVLTDPNLKKYYEILSEPGLIENIRKIGSHENLKTLGLVELFLALGLMLYRSYRYSNLQRGRWIARFWIGLWTFALYLALGLVVAPSLLLGNSYLEVLRAFLRVFAGN